MPIHEKYMRLALGLAKKAALADEVPVGCVVIFDGKIVGRGKNARETKQNALCHAEITAIEQACKKIGSWRLCDCDLYVTLEPCPMCAGAIINSRVRNVYFGAHDKKAGACGSVLNLFEYPFNHKPTCTGDVLGRECAQILTDFFKRLRAEKR